MSPPVPLAQLAPIETVLKLPHPYLTEYNIRKAPLSQQPVRSSGLGGDKQAVTLYQLCEWGEGSPVHHGKPLPEPLHDADLFFTEFTELKSSELPPQSNNGSWARARRSPSCTALWKGEEQPTLGQAWLLIYALFTHRSGIEVFRLELRGSNARALGQQLKDVLLAIAHPVESLQRPETTPDILNDTVVVLRNTFWQGAGSPFGPRPVWVPSETPSSLPTPRPLSSYPLTPLQHTMTLTPAGNPSNPGLYQQSWHPIRPAKPAPGSVVYSRWIPHLKENFSMVALDYHDPEHLRLFHEWQNDPRVSQGWNETGTLGQHREYLRKIDEDPHQIALMARFEDTCFAYFEVYWGKVRICQPSIKMSNFLHSIR
jgi:N5-hydroxy-L-ornithine N5-transacylase